MWKRSVIDIDSYITFITEHKEMLYRIAFGYLHDETKAIDAVDEAIYLGYTHIHDLKEAKYLKTWVVRIVINECYNMIRKSKREYLMDYLIEGSSNFEDDTIHIKIAVRKLPEELRKIIVLRYFAGYTISETAEILDIPEGTVSTRCKKALNILKIEFSE